MNFLTGIRTIRRFLEKGHSTPQLIVISVPDPDLFRYCCMNLLFSFVELNSVNNFD